jgi:hypothetical protein
VKRILIAGPGRSGTSLLVKLLDRSGLDTTASTGPYFPEARAGGEGRLTAASPRVVKSPRLTYSLPNDLDSGLVKRGDVEVVLIPVRDLNQAAASRWENSKRARRLHPAGGLWMVRRPTRQADSLADGLCALLLSLEQHGVRYELVHYPRFSQDFEYLWRKVGSYVGEARRNALKIAWEEASRVVVEDRRPPRPIDDLLALALGVNEFLMKQRKRVANVVKR